MSEHNVIAIHVTVALIVINVWSLWTFYAWPRKLWDKLFRRCWHQWVDTTVPFSDYTGGWHVCTKCPARKYIKWGWEYQRLKAHGQIVEDDKLASALMDQYTGFSKLMPVDNSTQEES